jgi:hypothetical protein
LRELQDGLDLFRAMLNDSGPFLLSKEAFWPLSERSASAQPYPKLSIGLLLLTLDELRVRASEMDSSQGRAFADLTAEFEELRHGRPANLEKKALAEIRQRLNLWRSYLTDLTESNTTASSYPVEVRHRSLLRRLQDLVREGTSLHSMREEIRHQDARLRRIFQRGEFVWDSILKPAYPESEYWFLYGRPTPLSPK